MLWINRKNQLNDCEWELWKEKLISRPSALQTRIAFLKVLIIFRIWIFIESQLWGLAQPQYHDSRVDSDFYCIVSWCWVHCCLRAQMSPEIEFQVRPVPGRRSHVKSWVTAVLGPGSYAMRKSFQELCWKCEAFNLKKLKLLHCPVGTMVAGGPAAGGQRQASSLGRPKAGPSWTWILRIHSRIH